MCRQMLTRLSTYRCRISEYTVYMFGWRRLATECNDSRMCSKWYILCIKFISTTHFSAQEPARYELTVTIVYPVSTPVGVECLQGYTDLVAAYFDQIDTTLSQRCSSSVQVFVRFLDVKFFSSNSNVSQKNNFIK